MRFKKTSLDKFIEAQNSVRLPEAVSELYAKRLLEEAKPFLRPILDKLTSEFAGNEKREHLRYMARRLEASGANSWLVPESPPPRYGDRSVIVEAVHQFMRETFNSQGGKFQWDGRTTQALSKYLLARSFVDADWTRYKIGKTHVYKLSLVGEDGRGYGPVWCNGVEGEGEGLYVPREKPCEPGLSDILMRRRADGNARAVTRS